MLIYSAVCLYGCIMQRVPVAKMCLRTKISCIPQFKVQITPKMFFSLKRIYLLFETLKRKIFLIRMNPRFSVPRRNLENTAIFVARPSLRRMGPAAVVMSTLTCDHALLPWSLVMSTREDRISPVLLFPWGPWCNTYSKSAPSRGDLGCCTNVPDIKKDML